MRDREKPVYVANYDSNKIDDAFFRFLIVQVAIETQIFYKANPSFN